jgi:hypothetical protein
LNVKEVLVLATPETDRSVITEFVDPPPHGLDLAGLPSLAVFGKKAEGPSEQEKVQLKKFKASQNEKIRALHAERSNKPL